MTQPTTTNNEQPDNDQAHWLKLAQVAIAEIPEYEDATVSWMAHTHNAVFSVQNGPQSAVLTLYKQAVDLSRLQSETVWLDAIAEETDLTVGRIIKLLKIHDEQNNKIIVGALRDYVEGAPKDARDLTPHNMHAIGRFVAKLHQFSEQYTPPADFNRPRLDYKGLFEEGGVYDPEADLASMLPNSLIDAIEVAMQRIHLAMDSMGTDRNAFGLIHGDLLSKNILFYHNDVRAIDWEYSGWGYYLYDLTPLLWQLKTQTNYDELAAAYWGGYTSQRPFPNEYVHLLDTFIAARHIASIRWLTQNLDHPLVKEHGIDLVQQRAEEIAGFVATNKMQRRTITL
ncbi:MAG: phosphotransferase [Anaerolineae bacterium]|nr:phosphotransferase [Anaerolineae bacterium]